jgi:hypothetical protein
MTGNVSAVAVYGALQGAHSQVGDLEVIGSGSGVKGDIAGVMGPGIGRGIGKGVMSGRGNAAIVPEQTAVVNDVKVLIEVEGNEVEPV